ncbi:50S ribosomal protein L10 [Salinisphaera sp. USBA-960]|uniref:50S ribosomal protein L10 n=1 Tax=Salinisphaera orenii TaxID=856731 RepID=UPI000DBE83E4|nr:50S ribosomal protein L10 [Salifodinibacter halophilus]NNC26701.1 50S ribosomal protein L10 [Salifodinibacter halophilus]
MATSFQAKQAMVAEVGDVAKRAHSAVLAEYRGLSAGQMDELRKNAREDGAYLKVIKNTVAKRAVAGTDYECLSEALTGPVLMGFSLEDPGSAARVLTKFRNEHGVVQVTAVSLGGELLPAAQVERLASLPTYDDAISQLMRAMRGPVEALARTTREPAAKLSRSVAAVRDQKQAA